MAQSLFGLCSVLLVAVAHIGREHRRRHCAVRQVGDVDVGRGEQCKRDGAMVFQLPEDGRLGDSEKERPGTLVEKAVGARGHRRNVPGAIMVGLFWMEHADRSLGAFRSQPPLGVVGDPMAGIVLVHSSTGRTVHLAARLLVYACAATDVPLRETLGFVALLGHP